MSLTRASQSEQHDDDRDRQRDPDGLPEQTQIDGVPGQEVLPRAERDRAFVGRQQMQRADTVEDSRAAMTKLRASRSVMKRIASPTT